jgi:hypothetical protein
LKVAARFQRASEVREDARDLTTPVNKPKGISREITKDYAESEDVSSETVDPSKNDIQPEDVFKPVPKDVNVLNYVQEGWPGDSSDYKDMEKVLEKQVPKDKGYETVSNLSQYLIETEGGGGTPSVE